MKRLGLLMLFATTNASGKDKAIAITDVTIVSMEDNTPQTGTILIEEGRIKAIEPSTAKVDPARYQVIVGTGKFVMPGLFDSHMHFFQSGSLYTRPDAIDLRYRVPYKNQEFAQNFAKAEITFKRYLASGITSVVDVGGPFENFKVRDQSKGLSAAPQVYVAGPLLSTVERTAMDADDKPIVKVASKEEAATWVEKLAAKNPDFIKIWYIVPADGSWKDNAAIVEHIIQLSHGKGIRVAVHATELDTARAAVKYGADVLVHSVEDKPVDAEFIQLLKGKSVAYIPTLSVTEGYQKTYRQLLSFSPLDYATGDTHSMGTLFDLPQLPYAVIPQRIQKAMTERKPITRPDIAMRNLKTLSDAGVAIVTGTDAGNIGTFHGSAIYRELEMMADAGMKPLEILKASTLTPARMLKVDHAFGSIKIGKIADLILLDRDPREDVRHTLALHTVIKSGHPYTRSELLPKTPADVVQSQLNAYHTGNIDHFVQHFATDASYGPYQGSLRKGHAGLRETWGQLFERTEWIRLRIAQRIVKDNYVFDVECGVAKTKEKGELKTIQGAALYRVENGLIQEMLFLPNEESVAYPKEIGRSGTFKMANLCQASL